MADTEIACDGTCSSHLGLAEQDPDALKGRMLGGLSVLPAVGLALLPNGACPVCLAAYAGVLSSIGIGVTQYANYLFPLTLLFLVLSVTVLAYRALKHDRYGPFVVGAIGALIIVFAKFLFDWDLATYGGIALLVAAPIWNSWPRRASTPFQRLQEARLREAIITNQRRRKDDGQA